jgi:CelD/BcsL family acetyltransferase involved in cellulose biosynthesis
MQETAIQAPGLAPVPLRERPAPSVEIAVRVLDSAEAFAALAPDWNRLHAETPLASVLTSWIWQYQWWLVYGREQPLRLLVAYDGPEVVGILPLYVHTASVLGVRVRLLRFIGTGGDTHPDDLGPVLEPRRAERVAEELARAALALPDGDVLLLTDLPPESALLGAVERRAQRVHRPTVAAVSERIAYVRLPATWDEYLRSLSSHRRTRIRYARRRLASAHGARFFVWSDPASLDAAFERLAELHHLRWQASGGSESFSSAEYLEFHRRVIKACFPRGWLRLYCLELDGEIAAMSYCYRFRNTIFCMQNGFDARKGKLEPGNVLLSHAFEHAITEGNEVFDFLRGDHGYKDHLCTGRRETRAVWAFRATLGGLAFRLRRVWLPLLKARLQRRPPPKLRTE